MKVKLYILGLTLIALGGYLLGFYNIQISKWYRKTVDYTTTKTGERRKFRHLIVKWWHFKFVIFWMRSRLKIETTFDNWGKKK